MQVLDDAGQAGKGKAQAAFCFMTHCRFASPFTRSSAGLRLTSLTSPAAKP